jgi:hypothetical protein
MAPDVQTKAREIGAGNLSGGVAKAVQAYRATDSGTGSKK